LAFLDISVDFLVNKAKESGIFTFLKVFYTFAGTNFLPPLTGILNSMAYLADLGAGLFLVWSLDIFSTQGWTARKKFRKKPGEVGFLDSYRRTRPYAWRSIQGTLRAQRDPTAPSSHCLPCRQDG
jgi:hypothetical protein